MKTLLLLPILLTSCITIQDIVPSFDNPNKINETNYMKTPCILDGVTVKKKPKVINVLPNDTHRAKKRKEG
jgi:hypothetical protein